MMNNLMFTSLECQKIEPLPSIQAITWFVSFNVHYEDNGKIIQKEIYAFLMPYSNR
jgi:hypothetical protein